MAQLWNPGTDGPPGPQGDKGDTGDTGATGTASITYKGSGLPTGAIGVDNDYYIDSDTSLLYGPKALGVWPSSAISLKGTGFEAVLVDYAILGQVLSLAGVVSVSLDNGNTANVTLTADVTSFTITDWPVVTTYEAKLVLYVTQGVAPFKIFGWQSEIKWIGANQPVFSTTPGEIDVIVLTSIDGGSTIVGAHVGTAA